ncbi:hypothetical protein JAAARDRAFT_41218 [Jaapia argillacea MUCL 33604]|uniref:Uncharacterized protein n=1 Tax=Jaapia argillacea MUCL 33604 TaxID=933084 RepID=A0A067P8X1_9AGAM|nr:hypothetical protein JAAARDRAFT_41218 [Jaapia argillacea MUCL 33604]
MHGSIVPQVRIALRKFPLPRFLLWFSPSCLMPSFLSQPPYSGSCLMYSSSVVPFRGLLLKPTDAPFPVIVLSMHLTRKGSSGGKVLLRGINVCVHCRLPDSLTVTVRVVMRRGLDILSRCDTR